MCGRFTLRHPAATLTSWLARAGYQIEFPDFRPRFNIAPTQLVCTLDGSNPHELAVRTRRWGLIPSWSRPENSYQMINARAETVATKPSFRTAFQRRRCLIVADGFFEWIRDSKPKQPVLATMRDGDPFAFAALWEPPSKIQDPPSEPPTGGEPLPGTTAIITTDANPLMATIHDRMPVILDPADWETWLWGEREQAQSLLRPYPADAMNLVRVNPVVNSARHDGPDCIEPLQTG